MVSGASDLPVILRLAPEAGFRGPPEATLR